MAVLSNTKYKCCGLAKGAILLDHLTEMLKGVLEGCVLEIINRGATYGYQITRKLNALGFTDIVEGTVYTILIRFEKNKLVETEKNLLIWGLRASSTRSIMQGARNCAVFGINGALSRQKSTS